MIIAINSETEKSKPLIIAQGKVASVNYLQGSYFVSSKTVITFENGSNYVLDGTYCMPSNTIEVVKIGESYSVQNSRHIK